MPFLIGALTARHLHPRAWREPRSGLSGGSIQTSGSSIPPGGPVPRSHFFWRYTFRKCIFWRCIFRKCIFWRCRSCAPYNSCVFWSNVDGDESALYLSAPAQNPQETDSLLEVLWATLHKCFWSRRSTSWPPGLGGPKYFFAIGSFLR